MDGVETQNVENYVAGTGRTFRIPAPGHRRPHDIIAGGDVITGGPRPVPGLSNGHGYDVMNCVIVMTSCEYQALNANIFYYYYIYFERKGVVHRSAPVRHLVNINFAVCYDEL